LLGKLNIPFWIYWKKQQKIEYKSTVIPQ